MRIDADSEREFLQNVFNKYGFSHANSALLADTLVDADLRGISSHGIQRLAWYTDMIEKHIIEPGNDVKIIKEMPTALFVDANKNMGQIASKFTMEKLITKAKKSSIAMGVVRNSNHFGTAGYYARMASQAGLVGIATTNTRPLVVPTNATKAFLGSNAFAFSFPADPHPFVFDGATSVVSSGKIQVFAKNNQPIPGDWAIDAHRQIVKDPAKVEDNLAKVAFTEDNQGGGVLTLGGNSEINSNYKGFGNSLIIELLTGILAQGPISADTSKPGHHDFSQFFLALDPAFFGDLATLKKSAQAMFDRIRELDHIPGKTIFIPGDREYKNDAINKQAGIVIDDKTADELKIIGQKKQVPLPKVISA